VLAVVPFRKTHNLDELSEAAAPIYPGLEPLLGHMRVRTYWGFAFRYPILGEGEEPQEPPTPEEIEETLRHLSDLRTRSAAAAGTDRD
jgi:hypothetical protein